MYFLPAASASQSHFKDEKTFKKKEQRRRGRKGIRLRVREKESERQRCGDKGMKGAWQHSKIGKITF